MFYIAHMCSCSIMKKIKWSVVESHFIIHFIVIVTKFLSSSLFMSVGIGNFAFLYYLLALAPTSLLSCEV